MYMYNKHKQTAKITKTKEEHKQTAKITKTKEEQHKQKKKESRTVKPAHPQWEGQIKSYIYCYYYIKKQKKEE